MNLPNFSGGGGSLLSGLLQGLAQGMQRKQLREEEKKEKDARLKLFEVQLEREKRAQAAEQRALGAQAEIFKRLRGVETLPGTGVQVMDPGPTPSLTDLLADPESAMLMLQSGLVKGDDIIKQQNNAESRKMLESLMGGGARGMELQGLKIGPSGELMPDLGLPAVTTQTVDTPEGPRIRTFEQRTGRQVAELGAPEPDRVTPEQGGRIQALRQAQGIVPQLRKAFVSKDGEVNRAAVLSAWSNAPFSEGRKIRAQVEDALDAVIRARTGAAVTKEELEGTLRQFLPNPLDNDSTVKDKLDRLDQFVSGAIDATTLPPRLRNMMKLPEGIPPGSRQIGTSGGKPVYETPDGKRLIVDY